MNGHFWTFMGAVLIVAALGTVYSWKLQADKAAELEAQLELLDQQRKADAAAMAEREKARTDAAKKAQEQRDALHEIEKNGADMCDGDFLYRLRGLCISKESNCDDAPRNPFGGMPRTDSTAKSDGGK